MQQSLDELREEFQSLLSTSETKESKFTVQVENLTSTIQQKDKEITDLKETLRRREKETADEWIQRETTIMAQFTEENKKSANEFETRLQDLRVQLDQVKEEMEQVKVERDAARDDVAVLQVSN